MLLFVHFVFFAEQAYCEVEVMKMYMPLCVRESGVVRWHLSEGAALKPGDRLATLELDDPTAVTMAEVRAIHLRFCLYVLALLLIGCFALFGVDGFALLACS